MAKNRQISEFDPTQSLDSRARFPPPLTKGGPRSLTGALFVAWTLAALAGSIFRRHQTCDFSEHVTSAPAELGGEIHNFLRNQARTKVLPQARKSHAHGRGTFGAFWVCLRGGVRTGGAASPARAGRRTPRGGRRPAIYGPLRWTSRPDGN